MVERAVQTATCYNGRLLLLERSGCGVARIGEELLAGSLALCIQAIERGVRHQHLATNLEVVGVVIALEHQRHRADGAHVGRHIVAHRAIASRYGTQKAAVLVCERNGRTIELQLADHLDGAHLLLGTHDKFAQFLHRIGIREREHRVAVRHARKVGGAVATHAHGWRVGVGKFGMCSLQVLQLAHHTVEVEVRNLGRIIDVVEAVVAVESLAQGGDMLFDIHIQFVRALCACVQIAHKGSDFLR